MQGIITFKGKEKGLEIYLDERSTYPVLREELMEKLKKNQDFFRDSETRVIIRGKKLSEAQRKELRRDGDGAHAGSVFRGANAI